MHDLSGKGRHTQIIHAGNHVDPATGAVSTPIYQSSTFAFKNADHGAASFRGDPEGGYIYTRLGNPTTAALEECVTILEKGCGGMACATGMAAVNLVYYALLSQNEHVVCTESLYGPSRMVLETEYPRFGIEASFVDSADPANVEAAERRRGPVRGQLEFELAVELAQVGRAIDQHVAVLVPVYQKGSLWEITPADVG